MKKLIALILCVITIFSALTIAVSAGEIKTQSKDVLDYYQMAVGNEYVVYGRMTTCHEDNDVSFLSMLVAGNVSNTYKKAVYTDVYYQSSTDTYNAATGNPISNLSKSTRGTGTSVSSTESYVEKVFEFTASTRPNIFVDGQLEAYKTSTNRFISYPRIDIAC